jgi:hypothetical protein
MDTIYLYLILIPYPHNTSMKKYKTLSRIAVDIVMVFSIAWAPLWLVVLLAIAFAWFFVPYYENILWGLALDSLYGLHSFYGLSIALAVFIIIELLKKRTRI